MPNRAKILIADDQSEILSALSFICSAEGYHTTCAESPEAAIAALGKSEFDLLLMDMNYHQDRTTGQEGLDLLRRVQQIDPSLPAVVMTAWASIPLAVEAVQAGARDFLQKPWENERLLSILRTQIQLRAENQIRFALEPVPEHELELVLQKACEHPVVFMADQLGKLRLGRNKF